MRGPTPFYFSLTKSLERKLKSTREQEKEMLEETLI